MSVFNWSSTTFLLDIFQDFLISEHMKPRMNILEISISSPNQVHVRPTKPPKLYDGKCAQFYHLKGFKNPRYQKMPITTNELVNWYSSMKIFDIENSL